LNQQNKYVERVREIIQRHLSDTSIRIFLFGSRAREKHSHSADIDVGFLGNKPIDRKIFQKIISEIEEDNIPFKVDLVDFIDVDSEFKKLALKDTIPWN